MKNISILGIRGIPAAHGGFETFAEYLALYLKDRDWNVSVYCQEDKGEWHESTWNGIRLIHVPVKTGGALGTIIFDLKTVLHSLKNRDLLLTLGYNTAIFNFLHWITGRRNIINMDGIEWRREKWGKVAKTWFWLNERFGCWFGSHLVADHPRIEDHLATRVSRENITMIPYGGRHISQEDASEDVLAEYGLDAGQYMILIARAEPENSILEVVQAFSRKPRGKKLVVLGNYKPESHPYHKAIMAAASEEVIFPGAIYDPKKIAALRFYALAYIHGHRVGGTNPSLVEALGAGNAILAHDNHFNRWVADKAGVYFSDIDSCESSIERLCSEPDLVASFQQNAREIFTHRFTWQQILEQYEALLLAWDKSESSDCSESSVDGKAQ